MNKKARKYIIGYTAVSLVTLITLTAQQNQLKNEMDKIKETSIRLEKDNADKLKQLEDTMSELEKRIIEEKTKYINQLEAKISQLEKPVVYNSNDISKISNITPQQLYRALEKVSPKESEFKDLAWVISEASIEYSVNELFLSSLIAQETGYGTSRRFIEDNNVGGYEVYTPKSKGRLFNTRYDSVRAVAKLLGEEYLKEDGMYFEGKSARGINTRYCTSSEGGQFAWSENINNIANDLKEVIEEDNKIKVKELKKELEDKTDELKESI